MKQSKAQCLFKFEILIGGITELLYIIGKNVPDAKKTLAAIYDDNYTYCKGDKISFQVIRVRLYRILSENDVCKLKAASNLINDNCIA